MIRGKMKNFIYSLMTDGRDGAMWAPVKFLLYIISLIYFLGIVARRVLYVLRIFRPEKVPLKVVSVGNITLGGTGKTPFVIALAGIYKENLRREPTVLIRGYGWDEQAMLKKNLPDNPILVGESRVRSAHKAIKLYGSDTSILDDGFQHWEMHRDLDIVLIDSRNPFGNGQLFPRGILREPVSSIRRAHVVVFTKVNRAAVDTDAIKSRLRNIKSGLIFLEAVHAPAHFYETRTRKVHSLAFVKGRKVMLLSSIGDPGYFEETVKSLGAAVAGHIVFPDHHNYRKKDAERIMKICEEKSFDIIVTTDKDMVKLGRMSLSLGPHTLVTLMVEMRILKGKEELIDRLRRLYTY